MVPFAGRIRNGLVRFGGREHHLPLTAPPHAIHGTVHSTPWRIETTTTDSVTMSTVIGDPWPWSGEVRHRIMITDTTLRCELTISMHEDSPVQLGWHPWFNVPDRVEFDFASMLAKDADGITTLERIDPASPPLDDCFFEPNAWPRVHSGGHTIQIASDCPYWVRYDAPGGHVCIEPQSGPPNGINTKPLVLEAGRWFSRWIELRILDDAIE